MKREELGLYSREASSVIDLARLPVQTFTLGRVWIRTHTTDASVLSEVLAGSYQTLGGSLESVRTIVDLGANVGYASRWLLRKFPQARLVAVEPSPDNAAILHRNLAGAASIIEACIGGSERTVGML